VDEGYSNSTRKYVFVGGVADGQWVKTHGELEYFVRVAEKADLALSSVRQYPDTVPSVTIHTGKYRLHRIQVGRGYNSDVCFYADISLSDRAAIEELVRGYGGIRE